MTLLSVAEQTRLIRGGPDEITEQREDGQTIIAPHQFDRLQHFDKQLAKRQKTDTILDWMGTTARTRHWVGVLQAGGLTLEILPKIDRQIGPENRNKARLSLLLMLSLAGDVPLRERHLANLGSSQAPLSELLVALFARELHARLFQGLVYDYQTRREHLPVLRGKLLVGRQLSSGAAHRGRFLVEYDEYTTDTLLNRTLKAACGQALPLAQTTQTEQLLRRCQMALRSAGDVPPETLRRTSLVLDRRHERFAIAFGLARLLLLQRGVAPQVGETRSFSLLFDMNMVFERFVAALMRRYVLPALPNLRLHHHARHRWKYLLESTAQSDKGILRLEPDMLLTRGDMGSELLTLDTKWKRLDMSGHKRGTAREDLYQLYAYAQRYQCLHNVLLYPYTTSSSPTDYKIPAPKGEPSPLIHVRFLDLRGQLSTPHLLGKALLKLLRPLLD